MAIIRYRNADGTIKEVVCLKGDKGDKGDAGGTAAETTVENGNDIRIPHGGGQSAPLGDNVQDALENLADAFNGTYIYTDTKTEDAMQFARNTFCNALKGKAEGELVTLRDVSPVGHNVGVEVSGKNLANKAAFVEYPSVRKYLDVYLPAGNYYYSSNMHAASGAVFWTGIVADGEIANNTNTIQMLSNFAGAEDSGVFTITESGVYRFLIYCSDAEKKAALDAVWDNVWIQIERGTTSTPYTPYIEDTSAAKVRVRGKNWYNSSFTFGGLAGGSGGVYDTKTRVVTDYIEVKPNTRYTISGYGDYAMGNRGAYDKDKNWICMFDLNKVEIPANTAFIRLHLSKADNTAEFTEEDLEQLNALPIQLELGTTTTEYEPYTCTEYEQYEAISSISPNMTVTTDTDGAMVTVDYNRDINKAFEALMQMVATTGGNV